jgi:hypothetical protein
MHTSSVEKIFRDVTLCYRHRESTGVGVMTICVTPGDKKGGGSATLRLSQILKHGLKTMPQGHD